MRRMPEGWAGPAIDILPDSGSRKRIRLPVWLLAGLGLVTAGLAGQHPPTYQPRQLDCGVYRQELRATVLLESGRQRTEEHTGRHSRLMVTARAGDSSITIEARIDSLLVWREGSGERLSPETDGVIGARYLGRLSPRGSFTVLDTPFVPDEVQDIMDLRDLAAELFPALPAEPLGPGGSWSDGLGMVLTRDADRVWNGQRVSRYRLTRRFVRTERTVLPDSSQVTAERNETEQGTFDWSEELGPVRWVRSVHVEVGIPAGGPVRQSFRTSIEQVIRTERVGTGGC